MTVGGLGGQGAEAGIHLQLPGREGILRHESVRCNRQVGIDETKHGGGARAHGAGGRGEKTASGWILENSSKLKGRQGHRQAGSSSCLGDGLQFQAVRLFGEQPQAGVRALGHCRVSELGFWSHSSWVDSAPLCAGYLTCPNLLFLSVNNNFSFLTSLL